MKKTILLLLLSAGMLLSGGEFEFKNANFQITFDTVGGTIKKLIHNKVDWNAAGPSGQGNSFCDCRLGITVAPKEQHTENFGALEYTIEKWKTYRSGWADITFSARGIVYNWLRINKTYKVRSGNELEVVYELVNTGKTPRSVSLSNRVYFYRSDKENYYWQPHVQGLRKLKQQSRMYFSKLPPRNFMAVGSDDNSGLLMELPGKATAGIMNWFFKGRSATMEFFSDETIIPAGGKRVIAIKLHFAENLNALIAKKKFGPCSVKGKIPPLVDSLADPASKGYKFRTVKEEFSGASDYFDVELKNQYKDSWRAVTLPSNIPLDKIAVFKLENGTPSFDRPVGYVLNGRELLLKIPGFNPKGGIWRSTLKNNVLSENFGSRRSYTAGNYNCRIYYDRTDGLKLKEKAPAGGELIPNGDFETLDPKNPALPADHPFAGNRHFYADYLKTEGVNGSACMRGGEMVFHMIPEEGRSYKVSFMYKNVGTDSMSRCWFFFYDADGKRLMKLSKLLTSSPNSFGWKKFETKVYAPAGTASMALSVSRSSKKTPRVYLDNVSCKAEPLSCVKLTPLDRGRRELTEQWGVPLEYLEKVSLEVENPHKKWFCPAAKAVDVLYLPFENGSGRLMRNKRIVVELAHRMPLNLKVIPVLRKFIASDGIYGVHVVTFGRELSLYTSEALKALPQAPKVVLITSINHKQHDKDLVKIFADWQKKGTHFLILSGEFFPALRGKAVKAPIDPLVPQMKKVARNRAVSWYKKGKSYVVLCNTAAAGNPVIPAEMESSANRYRIPYISKDFPWWEYQNLGKLHALRYLAGVKSAVQLTHANEKELTVKSDRAQSVTVEVVCSNMFREVKQKKMFRKELKKGVNKISLPVLELPGGLFVADLRVLDGKGQVLDAGAFRIERTLPVRAEFTFKNKTRIFNREEPLVFDLKLTGLPAESILETEVEDTYGRVIARKSFPAKNMQRVTMELPSPRTVLNTVVFRVKKNGRTLIEGIREFSSPEGPTDFTEFFGMTWGFQSYLARFLELDGVTANSPYSKNVQNLYRFARLENLAASPMGLASVRSNAYRGDVKTADTIRKPCFRDPDYLAKNSQLMNENYGKNNLLGYYDIRDFWSGDEQFLGSTVCYSPHCLKEFRSVLKKEYKTIGALNKEWGTDFSSFDKVIPSQLNQLKSKENLAPWLDHKMYMAATFAWGQFGSHLPDLLKFNRHARMGASGTQKPGYSYDWAQYMKYCRVMSYYGGIQVKLIHDFGGKDILAGRWMTYCYADTDQETYCVSPMWEGLLRGGNMAAIWPPSMINGDGTPTRNVRFVKSTMDELRKGYTKLWLTGKGRPEIAILYSQSSLYTALATFGREEWLNTQSSWLRVLDDMKYDSCYMSYEQLAQGVPNSYKVVILPAAVSLSDREVAALEAFVKKGGTVIADFSPGRYDGHGKRQNSTVLNKLFAPFSGPIDIAYQQLPQLGGRFKVAEKGMPLIQKKVYGKGRTFNFNFSLSDYHFVQHCGAGGEFSTASSGDNKLQLAIRKVVKSSLDSAGVNPSMAVLDPQGNDLPCMALVREDGGTQTAALYVPPVLPRVRGVVPPPHDLIDRKKGLCVTVRLLFKGHIYDCRSGKYLGNTDTFKAFLVPGIANFYSIQKSRVTGVELQLSKTAVKAGDTVKCTFKAAGAVGAQVFNVTVTDPAGKTPKIYRKNFRCAGNTGVYMFQIPFNAATGIWQVCVTHVNTKAKSALKINVR